MAETVQEIERKYMTDGAAQLPPLDGIDGVARVTGRGTAALDATYYDTPGLRLAAHRITLRRRTGGDDAGWHLKLPLGTDTREEVRLPLGDGDRVPGRLAALVRAHSRGEPLVPVVRLVTVRQVQQLLGPDGTALAEVSHDQVTAHLLDASSPEGAPPVEWAEVEVELATGPLGLLDAVEARLAEAGLRRSGFASKLEHALGTSRGRSKQAAKAAKAAKAGGRGKKGKKAKRPTAGQAVLGYLAEHIDRLTTLDPAVRREQPDAVHQMRVSARRLRSALRTFRMVLDRAATEPLAAELTWLGAELGADRDREVLTERLRQRVAELPEPLVLGPVSARLQIWSTTRRTGTRTELLEALDGERYLALLDTLDALLADPPLLAPAAEPAGALLPRALLADWKRLARRVDAALAMPPGPDRDLLLHEARKAAKRARYAAEAAGPALGRPAERLRAEMKAVQELLGEHQDSVVARDTLRELAVQAHAAGESAFTYGLLHQVEHDRAAAAEARLPGAWRRASRRGLLRRLGG